MPADRTVRVPRGDPASAPPWRRPGAATPTGTAYGGGREGAQGPAGRPAFEAARQRPRPKDARRWRRGCPARRVGVGSRFSVADGRPLPGGTTRADIVRPTLRVHSWVAPPVVMTCPPGPATASQGRLYDRPPLLHVAAGDLDAGDACASSTCRCCGLADTSRPRQERVAALYVEHGVGDRGTDSMVGFCSSSPVCVPVGWAKGLPLSRATRPTEVVNLYGDRHAEPGRQPLAVTERVQRLSLPILMGSRTATRSPSRRTGPAPAARPVRGRRHARRGRTVNRSAMKGHLVTTARWKRSAGTGRGTCRSRG